MRSSPIWRLGWPRHGGFRPFFEGSNLYFSLFFAWIYDAVSFPEFSLVVVAKLETSEMQYFVLQGCHTTWRRYVVYLATLLKHTFRLPSSPSPIRRETSNRPAMKLIQYCNEQPSSISLTNFVPSTAWPSDFAAGKTRDESASPPPFVGNARLNRKRWNRRKGGGGGDDGLHTVRLGF